MAALGERQCLFGLLPRREGVDLAAEYHAVHVQPCLLANLAGDYLVATGEDLRLHAVGVRTGGRLESAVLRGGGEGKVANQYQVRFVRCS